MLQQSSTGTSSGYLTRVGSTIGLDGLMRAPSSLEMLKEKLSPYGVADSKSKALPGDSIEIWDVRRGWVGKWSITGSGGEGGISGMCDHLCFKMAF